MDKLVCADQADSNGQEPSGMRQTQSPVVEVQANDQQVCFGMLKEAGRGKLAEQVINP